MNILDGCYSYIQTRQYYKTTDYRITKNDNKRQQQHRTGNHIVNGRPHTKDDKDLYWKPKMEQSADVTNKIKSKKKGDKKRKEEIRNRNNSDTHKHIKRHTKDLGRKNGERRLSIMNKGDETNREGCAWGEQQEMAGSWKDTDKDRIEEQKNRRKNTDK